MRSMQLTNLPHTLHHPEEGEEAKAGRVKSEGDAEPSASEKEVPGKVAVKTKVVEAPPPPKSDFDRVSTLAGGGSAGSHDGPAQLATFFDPAGLGEIYRPARFTRPVQCLRILSSPPARLSLNLST